MTQEQLYAEYLAWLNGLPPLPCNRILQFPLANQDVFEDDSSVMNRLYFVIPHMTEKKLLLFTFFEENSFTKDANGDLLLLHSSFYIQR